MKKITSYDTFCLVSINSLCCSKTSHCKNIVTGEANGNVCRLEDYVPGFVFDDYFVSKLAEVHYQISLSRSAVGHTSQ